MNKEAMKNYEDLLKGKKLFTELPTVAVYETPFCLRYPVTASEPLEDLEEYDIHVPKAGKTIEECEAWLNTPVTPDTQGDTMMAGFMESIVDEDYGYADDVSDKFRTDVANGLIKNLVYRFDDEQSGKFYMETTRKLTDEELEFITEYYNEFHYQGQGDMSESFNVFLGHARILDVWNSWDDAEEKQTTFEFSELPLEEYLTRTQPDETDFAEAVTSIRTDTVSMEQ